MRVTLCVAVVGLFAMHCAAGLRRDGVGTWFETTPPAGPDANAGERDASGGDSAQDAAARRVVVVQIDDWPGPCGGDLVILRPIRFAPSSAHWDRQDGETVALVCDCLKRYPSMHIRI